MRCLVMAPALAALAALAELAGCELGARDAYVLCHNANCAYTDPSRDDTLEAFRESIALVEDDRSMLDGIEIDLIWDPLAQRCVFEHDFADAATAPDAAQVVGELAAHLRRHGRDASWNRERFFVKLELKAGAAPDGAAMTPEDRRKLADCALAQTAFLEPAAVDAELELVSFYESEDVGQLVVLTQRPGWQSVDGPHGRRRLAMNYSYDPPRTLWPDIGVVTMNWRWARDGDYTTYQDLQDNGLELMVWMFDANQKALGAIEHLAPTYIDTNEAPLFRAWLDRD